MQTKNYIGKLIQCVFNLVHIHSSAVSISRYTNCLFLKFQKTNAYTRILFIIQCVIFVPVILSFLFLYYVRFLKLQVNKHTHNVFEWFIKRGIPKMHTH